MSAVANQPERSPRHRSPWLFARLAAQNMGRRPARTAMLALAVALGTGTAFASYTLAHGIWSSLELNFSRMGADAAVVPRDTLVNLTSALLTVQPTAYTLDRRVLRHVSAIPGVERAAPQRILFSTASQQSNHEHSGADAKHVTHDSGAHDDTPAVVAFDPSNDVTVLPWLGDRLDRALATGDVILGSRHTEKPGESISLCGRALPVYGRLESTGVGPFDRGTFVTFDTARQLTSGSTAGSDPPAAPSRGCLGEYSADEFSVLLLRLSLGTSIEQVRFAIAGIHDVKMVQSGSIMTSTRQSVAALLAGLGAITVLMLLIILLALSILFSAIVEERRAEVGMLMAVGARRTQVLRMMLAEAGFTTALGGVCGMALGIVFLLAFDRSLGFWLAEYHIPFVRPRWMVLLLSAALCLVLSFCVGALGALLPACRAARWEPYVLLRGENG